jgi:hypothetical protein
MYFFRLEVAHLSEGFKVLEKIQKSRELRSLVEDCPANCREAFNALNDEPVHKEVNNLVTQVRSRITFHYDEKSTKTAIADRATRDQARASSVTRGSHAHLFYNKAADDIILSIIVRQILKVPRGADDQVAVDKLLMKIHETTLRYLEFAGPFIWRFVEG